MHLGFNCPIAPNLHLGEWLLTLQWICQPLLDRMNIAIDAWGNRGSSFFQGSNDIFYRVSNSLSLFALTLAQDKESFSKSVRCKFNSQARGLYSTHRKSVLEIHSFFCIQRASLDWSASFSCRISLKDTLQNPDVFLSILLELPSW